MSQDTNTPLETTETSSTHDHIPERAESGEGLRDTNGAETDNGVQTGPDTVDNTDYPVADFLDPIKYGWTEEGFEARQAVKRYSEDTHADY